MENFNSTDCNCYGGATGIYYHYISLIYNISFINIIRSIGAVSFCFINTNICYLNKINIINQTSQCSL